MFDPNKHKDEDPNRFLFKDIEMVSVMEKKCRIKFRIALKYDPSGEKNITEGMSHQIKGEVKFDGNRQPKHYARRNYPWTMKRATASMYWCVTCDIQRL